MLQSTQSLSEVLGEDKCDCTGGAARVTGVKRPAAFPDPGRDRGPVPVFSCAAGRGNSFGDGEVLRRSASKLPSFPMEPVRGRGCNIVGGGLRDRLL